MLRDGIEVSCSSFLYKAKVHENNAQEKFKQFERDLMFKKNASIHFTQNSFNKAFS